MAITKIRKISSWTFILTTIIGLAVLALFFLGGNEPPLNGKWKFPTYTGELLIWAYLLLGTCALGMLTFGIVQFALKFKTNTKASLMALGVILGLALLHIIFYSIGDTTPFSGINRESQKFNVDSWLKITDMWLYVMYTLIGLSIAAMVWGAIKKALNK